MAFPRIAPWIAVPCAVLSVARAGQPDLATGLDAKAAEAFAAKGPGGVVLVARDGRPLMHRAYGMASLELGVRMQVDHVFLIGSITKEFTAAAVLRLVAEGQIALDADVRAYVPDAQTYGRRITIEQVLTHTSGLPNLVDRPDFEDVALRDHDATSLLALTRDMPLHFEPGTSFRYSDTGYILLGAIVEQRSGLSYAEFIERTFSRPLGLSDTSYAGSRRLIPRRVSGYSVRSGVPMQPAYMSLTVPHAAGALAATASDLLRWHLALRSGSVVPRALLERAWQPRLLPDGTRSGYGFGFQVCTLDEHRTVEHGGFVNGFGAQALQLPDEDIDVIVLVNNDSDAPDAGALARRLARVVIAPSPKPAYQELSARQRAALAGTYRTSVGAVRHIVERDGELYLQRGGETPLRLAALSPTALTTVDSEGAYVLTFEIDAGGQATRFDAAIRCEPAGRAARVPAAF